MEFMEHPSKPKVVADIAQARTADATVKLANGVEMPVLGYGTCLVREGVAEAVAAAIGAGYRHIDTASIYKNETGVGEGVRRGLAEAGLAREDVFVTSKLWKSGRGYRQAREEFEATMERLGLDYLDLYLVHWPVVPVEAEDWLEQNLASWHAIAELYSVGRIRAIGVSNHGPHHLAMFEDEDVFPMVDQIEFHPGFMQAETREACEARGVVVEAWSPLGQGRMLGDRRIVEVAKRLGKSPAQIVLRWCLQHGAVPLPKSSTPERMAENADVFGFELSGQDMALVDAAGCGRIGGDPDMAPP